MPTLRVANREWWRIEEAVAKHADKDDIPSWSAMVNYYNVCVPSIITPLSLAVWNLYQRIDGTSNETYRSFIDLPAFWVDACAVIDREIGRIDKVRADKARREQQALIRRLGSNGHK